MTGPNGVVVRKSSIRKLPSLSSRPWLQTGFDTTLILVPRAHDPFGRRQGSRPLAGTEAGSPRITDFRLLCAASEI